MNFDYEQGYFKALVDVKNYFDSHSTILKNLRMYNSKKIPLLLDAFIRYHEKMIIVGDQIDLKLTADGKKVILDEDKSH